MALFDRFALSSEGALVNDQVVAVQVDTVRHHLVTRLQQQHVANNHIGVGQQLVSAISEHFDVDGVVLLVELGELAVFVPILHRTHLWQTNKGTNTCRHWLVVWKPYQGDYKHSNPNCNAFGPRLLLPFFRNRYSNDGGNCGSNDEEQHDGIADNGLPPQVEKSFGRDFLKPVRPVAGLSLRRRNFTFGAEAKVGLDTKQGCKLCWAALGVQPGGVFVLWKVAKVMDGARVGNDAASTAKRCMSHTSL